MQQVFLIIISALGAIYAFVTGAAKVAAGLLIVAISLIFAIPTLAKTELQQDIFGALMMILFAIGIFVIVFKKKKVAENKKEPDQPAEKDN